MGATFHLGMDLGTAFSKLGLRHYNVRGGDRTYILYQPGTRDPTWPSLVAWDGPQLWFGCEAEARDGQRGVTMYRSLKMLFAFPDDYWPGRAPDLPEGMSIDDLLTWLAVYLLRKAHAVAVKKAKEQGEKSFRMTVTIGMPVDHLDREDLRKRYRTLAAVSYQLFRDCTLKKLDLTTGIRKDVAQSMLREARAEARVIAREDEVEWLRGEATAALLWAFNSPRTAPGKLYFDLDVGAGTASASSFIIDQEFLGGRWVKTHIGYYGAACQPPGADKCTAILARNLGADFAAVQGRENRFTESLPAGHRARTEVRDIGHDIFGLMGKVLAVANRKLPAGGDIRNSELFLFGGGARIDAMRQLWKRLQIPGANGLLELTTLDAPPDLFGEDGEALDAEVIDRLLVAYGLSHYCADFPESFAPDEFHPVKLHYERRQLADADELYPR